MKGRNSSDMPVYVHMFYRKLKVALVETLCVSFFTEICPNSSILTLVYFANANLLKLLWIESLMILHV